MMLTRSVSILLMPSAVLLYACGVGAEEADSSSIFSVDGYGTLGVIHSSDDQADYITDVLRPDGVGYTHRWSANADSRFGLQISAQFTPKLSAVLQMVAEQGHDNSYMPTTELANLKYQFTPDFSIRVGRFLQPTFLFADTRKVGYAYPWVRPPAEVYNLVPVSFNDGMDLSYRTHIGAVTNTVEASIGSRNTRSPKRVGGGVGKARNTFSMMSTTEYGPATLRISYHQTQLTIPSLASLFDTFRQFGPEGMAIADRYDPDGDRVWFAGVGVSYDPGDWFAIGEWGTVKYHNILGESASWYVSGGYRFGTVTPYASFARLDVLNDTSDPGLTVSALPPELAGPAIGLNSALNAILAGGAAQQTVAVGMRWDFMPSVALKLQYEHVRRDDGSPGTFVLLQPGFEPGGEADLFSVAIDFIF